MKLSLLTFDIGKKSATPDAFFERVVEMVEGSWDEGSDLVVLPEFLWMGLEAFTDASQKLRGVANLFWNVLWPKYSSRLSRSGKGVIMGSVPCALPGGYLRNRSPIWNGREFIHQDKLHLTPWEMEFERGDAIRIWEFQGVRCVVIICLDIEIPEIAAALRGLEIELILVPSATETILGVERVGRCADARAVELGCYVGVCHLVGKSHSSLVDENIGRLAFFTPSQSAYKDDVRQLSSPLFLSGDHSLTIVIDPVVLDLQRAIIGETDPSKITPQKIQIEN